MHHPFHHHNDRNDHVIIIMIVTMMMMVMCREGGRLNTERSWTHNEGSFTVTGISNILMMMTTLICLIKKLKMEKALTHKKILSKGINMHQKR